MLLYRPQAELTGKRLSAHTIASFMAAQGAARPDAISKDVAMRSNLLLFLLRERTITYWRSNGWLKSDPFGTEFRLTTDGHQKVQARLAGEPKAQAVTATQVREAMQVITGAVRLEPLDSFQSPVAEQPPSTNESRDSEGENPAVQFVPTDERLLQAIWTRRGQADFRAKLIAAYGSRCAITNCAAEEALEAAHIVPFANDQNYDLTNGIVLRADIHTLFDLFLVSIDPHTSTVCLAPSLMSSYGELHGRTARIPSDLSFRPASARLTHHFEQWKLRWRSGKTAG